MRLVTFAVATPLGPVDRIGAWVDDVFVDLNAALHTYLHFTRGMGNAGAVADALVPPDAIKFLAGGDLSMRAANKAVEHVLLHAGRGHQMVGPNGEQTMYRSDQVELKAPLPRPNTMRDCLCFEYHIWKPNSGRPPIAYDWFEKPAFYKGNPDTVVGTGIDVRQPSITAWPDFESEHAIVIKRSGRNIPVEEAWDYIAGFTIFNDWSFRDIQRKEMAITATPSKGKDPVTTMGPCLVTMDELGDPRDLTFRTRVNGETWTNAHTGTMHWTWAELVAYVSREEWIRPGDVIASGTIGYGCGSELARPLKAGDVVEMEVSKIGVIRNRLIAPPEVDDDVVGWQW